MELHKPLSIAAIDDDESDLTTIQRILAKSNYNFNSFRSVTDFLAHIREEGCLPQLVLLDYHIPGTNPASNLELLSSLLLPVIVVSGEKRPVAIDMTIRAGAQGFICKDEISRQYLLERIGDVLQKESPARQARYRMLMQLVVMSCHVLDLPEMVADIVRLTSQLGQPGVGPAQVQHIKQDIENICSQIVQEAELLVARSETVDPNFLKLFAVLLSLKTELGR